MIAKICQPGGTGTHSAHRSFVNAECYFDSHYTLFGVKCKCRDMRNKEWEHKKVLSYKTGAEVLFLYDSIF